MAVCHFRDKAQFELDWVHCGHFSWPIFLLSFNAGAYKALNVSYLSTMSGFNFTGCCLLANSV